MIGSLLTRGLVLLFAYAYPAYECFKTVELNKPEIEQLRFWCQYWILIAFFTVLERVGDAFISWVPMYSEAKLAFFIYLWYPKTKGTTYVYESFFRPIVAKHEPEIDRSLLELRTRAGDIVVIYWQRAASYSQTRIFEILQYIASQSPSQISRSRSVQQQRQPQQISQQNPPAAPPIRRTAAEAAPQHLARGPPSPTKCQLQEPPNLGNPQMAVANPQTSTGPSIPMVPESTAVAPSAGETEAMQVNVANDGPNLPPQDTAMEETIRMTRGRLRKRIAAGAAPSTSPSPSPSPSTR